MFNKVSSCQFVPGDPDGAAYLVPVHVAALQVTAGDSARKLRPPVQHPVVLDSHHVAFTVNLSPLTCLSHTFWPYLAASSD